MKKIISIILLISIFCSMFLVGCEVDSVTADKRTTIEVAEKLQGNQPTPSDIDYSLERYNLTKRAYWVNGQREKALNLPCAVDRPLGYIVLFTANGICIGTFVVDGKVTSLNSYLTPDSEYYERAGNNNRWLADVDGSYGSNDTGIFFFTPDGKYVEWTGEYLYSDIPFDISETLLGGTK